MMKFMLYLAVVVLEVTALQTGPELTPGHPLKKSDSFVQDKLDEQNFQQQIFRIEIYDIELNFVQNRLKIQFSIQFRSKSISKSTWVNSFEFSIFFELGKRRLLG